MHYCPAGGLRDHATWLRGSCDGESSRVNSSDAGMKTSMMAMHDNVHLMLVKLRLTADMPYVALDMLKEVFSYIWFYFKYLKMYVFFQIANG